MTRDVVCSKAEHTRPHCHRPHRGPFAETWPYTADFQLASLASCPPPPAAPPQGSAPAPSGSGPGSRRRQGPHARGGSRAGAGSAHAEVTTGVSQPGSGVPLTPNFRRISYKTPTTQGTDSRGNRTTRRSPGAPAPYGARGRAITSENQAGWALSLCLHAAVTERRNNLLIHHFSLIFLFFLSVIR